jgi:excinuclease UvrABC nuclease subunit
MKSILDMINRTRTSLELEHLKVNQIPYRNYREIPTKSRGVYILEDELQRCIYVGKGWIRTRQNSHWPKAHGDVKTYHTDPRGWQYLREHNELAPKEWTIYYIEVEKETAISAMEGALIHLLQPLANDETYRDNMGSED